MTPQLWIQVQFKNISICYLNKLRWLQVQSEVFPSSSLVYRESSNSRSQHPIFIHPEPHNQNQKVHINSSQPCAMAGAWHLGSGTEKAKD